ncbi:MAG: hypothetical protein ABIY70_00920, partial [Capsulimonas sp.]|uniref:hypothetical protein n=1 Tax=Capsulimonas sp. TaxID=2494211 RepID=UPI0032664467
AKPILNVTKDHFPSCPASYRSDAYELAALIFVTSAAPFPTAGSSGLVRGKAAKADCSDFDERHS